MVFGCGKRIMTLAGTVHLVAVTISRISVAHHSVMLLATDGSGSGDGASSGSSVVVVVVTVLSLKEDKDEEEDTDEEEENDDGGRVVGGYMVGPVKTTGAEASEFSSNVFHDLCLYNIVFACVFIALASVQPGLYLATLNEAVDIVMSVL
uniref:Uncharacterized protein n=1 Tax=Vespula pensylvanica TaxID=30213 RepID=A0A834UAJ5_VESPE|nr:hypothetical protein H0235_008210 [Vespula pensylvanica]